MHLRGVNAHVYGVAMERGGGEHKYIDHRKRCIKRMQDCYSCGTGGSPPPQHALPVRTRGRARVAPAPATLGAPLLSVFESQPDGAVDFEARAECELHDALSARNIVTAARGAG